MSRVCPFATLAVYLSLGLASHAGDFVIVPDSVTLDGPHARQRVLVEARSQGRFAGDETARAKLVVEDPRIAAIASDGTLLPLGDGVTALVATIGDASARATITVRNAKREEPWSFRNHVEPVLARAGCNTGACHGAAAGKGGLKLTLRGYGPEVDYDVLTRQALGRRVNKTAPAESLMLLKPTTAIEHGGGRRFGVESLEYQIVSGWIAAGARYSRDDDPRLVSVSVLPEEAVLQPGQEQQVLVRASYSDGRVADVTRWARFDSSDAAVAKVGESGKVRVEAAGEASISVWFASQVARATITSPHTTAIDPKLFAAAPRRNRIDELNLAKLQALGIPPSPGCDDATFLRRAFLDATGTLPRAAEIDALLADESPERRSKWIERLLSSSEYVDYWSYKWSDLFLVSSRRLPAAAMWAFYRSIREAVAENTPWDEFAKRLITAKGSTLANGLANYFVLHRDPIDLAESSSMAFLGLSLTCARCHNHPMEKWTQDQYYGYANLFARVSLKDGAVNGEVIVSASPEGNIVHPRRGVTMAPAPLDAKPISTDERGDRREVFAAWLASPENPYFDRAIVNRVWRNYFGRGLVEPEDDLRATNPPSDEALFDWLVADFREHKRDIKHLIRTIMNSAVYARSSEPIAGNEADAKLLSHYPVKRLSAEVLLDAIAQVTEVPTTFGGYPRGWRSLQLPDAQVANTFLSAFGRPERVATCSCERSAEPSVSQALHLTNGDTLNEKLRDDKGAVARLASSTLSDDEVIESLYKAALTRRPSGDERAKVKAALIEAVAGLSDAKAIATARRQAIEDVLWAMLTGREFLFCH